MNKKQLYESIMKNVAKEVKKAIYEAENKKSEAQIKAESKLSQDEKVDLWIAGERDINLEACGADKLRKYYKIAKAKDFTSGVAQIERVAKSKNIKLEKEIKESASSNNVVYEEWIDINTNALFVGDICYALDDAIYDEVWINKCGALNGLVTDGTTTYAVVGGTAYGDGEYYDDHGNTFGVDAGNIGVTDLTYNTENSVDLLNKLGKVVEVPSGHANVDYYNENGIISIKIWDKETGKTLYLGEINTDESNTDDEDEGWSDDEYDDWHDGDMEL